LFDEFQETDGQKNEEEEDLFDEFEQAPEPVEPAPSSTQPAIELDTRELLGFQSLLREMCFSSGTTDGTLEITKTL
jgi:hypothetical protein